MEVEIRPGIVTKDSTGRNRCQPIYSRIVSLHAETNQLQFVVPGGLIGVGMKIDPTLCRADRLVGQVFGAVGNFRRFLPSTLSYARLCLTIAPRIGNQLVLATPVKEIKVANLVKGKSTTGLMLS